MCCGRPLYDYGMLDLAERQLRQILKALRPEIRAGTPLIGMEPSCLAVFRDELPELFRVPLWDVVLPLVYGRREARGFDIAGIAGTCFIPHPGVVVSCAHCFGGLGE